MRYAIITGLAILISACVSTPDQTQSNREVGLIQQIGWEPSIFDTSRRDFKQTAQQAVNSPIQFHGLVTSERGNPVANLPVEIIVFDRLLDPFVSPYFGWTKLLDICTDNAGRFSITKRQGAALVVTVRHPDYWEENDQNAVRTFLYADQLAYENEHPLPTSRQTPAVFTMIRKPPEAYPEKVSTGTIEIPHQKAIGIKLLGNSRASVPIEEAELVMQLSKGPPADSENYDWALTVQVPGGGIQTLKGLFETQAPESGYEPQLTLGIEAEAANWDHRGEWYCYIKTAAGNYGLLEIRVRTRNRSFVALEGTLNTMQARYID